MGRKYKKKTNKERDETALKNAFFEVQEKGASIRRAAEKYGVPKSTLNDYLSRDKKENKGFQLGNYAVRQVLTRAMEEELAAYLKQCSNMFYGLTPKITRQLTYEYALMNKVNVPNSWKRDESAGKDWFTGFMERHGDLSLRTPEATSLARMTSFNRTNLGVFQGKLEELLARYSLTESSIYNLDETGCTTVQRLPKIIAQKGAHQIGQVTSRERGELITLVGIICANGNALPPCLIFPRVRFDEARMMAGVPSACKGLVHPSGWMTTNNFPSVLQHFVANTRCTKDKKVLLILDNHESHLSLDAITYAKENGIVILTLPPHTSNKLQPLDRCVFGPFKTFFNQGLNAWMLQHPGRCVSIYDLGPIMCSAWDRAATPVNAKAGFRVTGIHPFDTGVFNEDDFVGASVCDRLLPDPTEPPTPSATQQDTFQASSELQPCPSTSQQSTSQPYLALQLSPTTTQQAASHPNLAVHPPLTTSQQVVSQADLIPQPLTTTLQSVSSSDLSLESETLGISPQGISSVPGKPQHLSPQDIRPFPKAATRKETARGRKRGKCMIVTDTPEKLEIEKRHIKRKSTKVKEVKRNIINVELKDGSKSHKTKRPAKKTKAYDEESSDNGDIINTQLLDAELNHSSDISEEDFEDLDINFLDKSPEEGDFVLLGIDPIKGRKVHYVAKLLSGLDNENEFQVSFLRKSMKGRGNCFCFPDIVDEATIPRECLIGVLPKPTPESIKRRQGYYNFCFSFDGYNMR